MAFPTNNTLLDDFNRSDGAAGGNWASTDIASGASALNISSNEAYFSGTINRGSWWSGGTFAQSEFYFTQTTNTDIDWTLFGRLQNAGTSGWGGYMVWYAPGSGLLRVWRRAFGTLSVVGGDLTLTTADYLDPGDQLGLEIVDVAGQPTIAVYRKRAAGSWTQLIQRTDTTSSFTSAGNIGIGMLSGLGSTSRFDNLTGGEQVVGPPEVDGDASLSGSSDLGASAVVTHEVTASASLSAQSGVSPTGLVERLGASILSGSSSAQITASRIAQAAAALSGNSSLGVAGVRFIQAQAALTASSNLDATEGNPIVFGASLLDAQSDLLANGAVVVFVPETPAKVLHPGRLSRPQVGRIDLTPRSGRLERAPKVGSVEKPRSGRISGYPPV